MSLFELGDTQSRRRCWNTATAAPRSPSQQWFLLDERRAHCTDSPDGPGADTASPGADTASSGADTASPGADTASPGADTASRDRPALGKARQYRDLVASMFAHAYGAYIAHAFPADELMPISCSGHDTLGGYLL